jgi:hypothetical protein
MTFFPLDASSGRWGKMEEYGSVYHFSVNEAKAGISDVFAIFREQM